MLISIYDEQFLNDEQRKRLQTFTDAWNQANARGDQAGMEAAHAAAERVRTEANYSGTRDGSSFVDMGTAQAPSESKTYTPAPTPEPYTPSPAPEAYTPAQLPSYQAQTDAVNQLYDAQREAALAALKGAYEANSSTLEAQRAEIPGVFQTQRNAAAAQSELAGRNFNEYAAASGLNSGTAGQAALARSNQLQGDLTALGQQEAEEQRKVDSQLAQLKIQYQKTSKVAQTLMEAEQTTDANAEAIGKRALRGGFTIPDSQKNSARIENARAEYALDPGKARSDWKSEVGKGKVKRKETIERVFADAKEKHAMRYTHHRSLARVERWVRLKFATMNLKKLANWSWKNSISPARTTIFSFFSHPYARLRWA